MNIELVLLVRKYYVIYNTDFAFSHEYFGGKVKANEYRERLFNLGTNKG